MKKTVKFFIAAIIVSLYFAASFTASAETSININNVNQLIFVPTVCDTCICPCPWDDPNTRDDDTCSCTGDGSGGPKTDPGNDD